MPGIRSGTGTTAGEPCLLGLDVGTLSTKGVLVDLSGRVLARAVAGHEVRHPKPQWMEHDAEADWWGDAVRVIRRLLEPDGEPTTRAGQIAGVCISGLFPALCPADGHGRPLRYAVLYADPRGTGQVARVAQVAGVALKGDEVIPKFLWLREHEAEVADATRMLFSAPGYVVYRLTGAFCVDLQTAYRFGGIVDESRRRWRGDVCAELGIATEILPSIHSPLDRVGEVTATAAQQTGLKQGTPVVAGTTDTFATLVGNGIVTQGEAMIYYGSTGLLTVCSQDLEVVLSRPELVDDETPFVLAAYLLNFGEVLEWFVDQVVADDGVSPGSGAGGFETLEAGAAEIPAGSEGLLALPHFSGRVVPQVEPLARGGFFGLTTRHSRFHLWRALLESFGYGIYQARLSLEERGIRLRRVVASGGGARSAVWRQIVSDVTGLAQEHVEAGDTARGAAFLAGYGLGLVDSPAAMRDRWLQTTQVSTPRPAEHDLYRRLYTVWRAVDAGLGPHYEALAEAMGHHPTMTGGIASTNRKRMNE